MPEGPGINPREIGIETQEGLVEYLKKRGFFIEKVSEGDPAQCDHKDHCFENVDLYIEGNFYCKGHTSDVLKVLKESVDQLDEERRKQK